jgi:murein DD-endopeptidase MepM/ murein hydrolase activator NlpD
VVVVIAAGGIFAMAPRGHAAPNPVASAWSKTATATVAATAEADVAVPTPAFASYRGKHLLLPVPVASLTVAAFHPTSFKDSLPMKPITAVRSISDAVAAVKRQRKDGTPAWPRAEADADDRGIWTGSVLVLWRTHAVGKRNTALDCGAKPGTPVFSPVDGVVMRIRPYKLYGRVNDFEFHIKPDYWNDVDVIILHVKDPIVAIGDRVVAGVTQIANVRNLKSQVSGLQLRSYTTEGGDHTHIQLNRIPLPNETWVLGQDPPGFKRKGH